MNSAPKTLRVALIAFASGVSISACPCPEPGTPRDYFERSTVIFEGTAIWQSRFWNHSRYDKDREPCSGSCWNTVPLTLFMFVRTWKGALGQYIVVTTSESSCMKFLRLGESRVVYARQRLGLVPLTSCDRIVKLTVQELETLGTPKQASSPTCSTQSKDQLPGWFESRASGSTGRTPPALAVSFGSASSFHPGLRPDPTPFWNDGRTHSDEAVYRLHLLRAWASQVIETNAVSPAVLSAADALWSGYCKTQTVDLRHLDSTIEAFSEFWQESSDVAIDELRRARLGPRAPLRQLEHNRDPFEDF